MILQGSKIRSSYIAFAKKEKKRLEETIANYDREVAVKQKEVDRLKGEDLYPPYYLLALTHIACRSRREDRVLVPCSFGAQEAITYVPPAAKASCH